MRTGDGDMSVVISLARAFGGYPTLSFFIVICCLAALFIVYMWNLERKTKDKK